MGVPRLRPLGVTRVEAVRLAASGFYPGRVNPRVRRLIVSGVLVGLLVLVIAAAIWQRAFS